MSRVLIIIPALNEEATIGAVLDSLRAEAPDCDVLVVDDGSTDATASIVARHGGAALVRLPQNLGIGGAMQTGYKYALRHGYDIAVQCDADGQHPVHQIPALVKAVETGRSDLAIGSRFVANTGYRPSLPRRIGKSVLSRIVDSLIGGGITDTTSGFRAMNRDVLALFAHRYPDDYPEAEALIIVYKNGLKAIEIPVNMNPRQGGRTSIRPHNAVYYMLKVVLAIFVSLFRKSTSANGDVS